MLTDPALRVLSLGGGVQSSTMLLMGSTGHFGAPPDLAIFADTGNEPPAVYRMIEWLTEHSGVEVMVVTAVVPIAEAISRGVDASGRVTGLGIPTHTVDDNGKVGMARRVCTSHWKILPIEKEIRRRLGVSRITRDSGIEVEQWLGISIDEVERVKPARPDWLFSRWPLIESHMSRADCERWWRENAPSSAPPLARSACAICPYRTADEWLILRNEDPELFDRACEVESDLNEVQRRRGHGHVTHYLHRRRIPLREAVTADHAAASQGGLSPRTEECSGSCWT